MRTQNKKSNRIFFSSSKSHSCTFSSKTKSGFTLIELLVVISIISLLSTIVLSSLNDARTKAQNTAKNEIVLQYINALELYASSNNGNYPESATISGNYTYSCLGFDQSDGCSKINGNNQYTGLNSLNENLRVYYAGLPKSNDSTISLSLGNNTLEWTGIWYIKNNSTYKLLWYLKNNSNCVRGSTTTQSGDRTLCTYPQT